MAGDAEPLGMVSQFGEQGSPQLLTKKLSFAHFDECETIR
jgi:hypothetical protein